MNRELVFAEAWAAENLKHGSISLAQKLMATSREAKEDEPGLPDGLSPFKRWRVAFILTPRDRVIIATIIQWLGTNVGWGWLCEVIDLCGYRLVRKDDETSRRAA